MRKKFKLCDPMPKTFSPKEEEIDDNGEYYYEDDNSGNAPGGSGGEYEYSGENKSPSQTQGGVFRPPMTGDQQPSGCLFSM
jgi:hypothetical protein